MKRNVLFLIILVLLFSAPLFGETEVWWGTSYMPGNLLYGGRAAYEFTGGNSTGFGIYPEGEMVLFKPYFEDISPLDVGASVKGRFSAAFGSDANSSGVVLGLGGFATAHLGLKGLDLPFQDFMDQVDYFIELGLVYDFLKFDSDLSIGLGFNTGFRYFLQDNLAVYGMFQVWRNSSGFSVGVELRSGNSQIVAKKRTTVDGKTVIIRNTATEDAFSAALTRFYTLYWAVFTAGGYLVDNSAFQEGQGVKWAVSGSGYEDTLYVTKALLKDNGDGSKWWKLKTEVEGEDLVYEFKVDADSVIQVVRFNDLESGAVRERVLDSEIRGAFETREFSPMTAAELEEWYVGTEAVTVPAGKFAADKIQNKWFSEVMGAFSYAWFLSREVPGGLVSYEWKTPEGEGSGQVVEISAFNGSELNTASSEM